MAISFIGVHFPGEIILTCGRWHVASLLSTRHLEEMMAERGVSVDHATVHRWVISDGPQTRSGIPPPRASRVDQRPFSAPKSVLSRRLTGF